MLILGVLIGAFLVLFIFPSLSDFKAVAIFGSLKLVQGFLGLLAVTFSSGIFFFIVAAIVKMAMI